MGFYFLFQFSSFSISGSRRKKDVILEDCKNKTAEAGFELESPAHLGNTTATPEIVLSMIEKVSSFSHDFTHSFGQFQKGEGSPAETIKQASAFATAMSQLLHHAKGVTRLAGGEEEMVDQIVSAARQSGVSAYQFFHHLQTPQFGAVPEKDQHAYLHKQNASLQLALGNLTNVTQKLHPEETSSRQKEDADLADVVERELSNAAKAIEEASRRLMALINAPKPIHVNPQDLKVHGALLDSAMAITGAIGNLIKCATASQQEIVSHGKGAASKDAFYKKNNRWTDGLISAAKAVAIATGYLVEAADGVVNGTKTMEDLVIAAQEVSAATAQLVAAARVKAIAGSKTQFRLEEAAKAVTQATKMLVKAAKAAAAKKLEEANAQKAAIQFSGIHDFKKKEMEQQVKILTIEKELEQERLQLANMRKVNFFFLCGNKRN